MGDDIIAERLDLQPRECLIDAFDFLQADDIRRAFLEPGQEMVEPLPDRIDVPGGNTHGGDPGWSITGKSRIFVEVVTTHFPAVAYHVQEGCDNRLEIRRESRRQGAEENRSVLSG